MDDVVVDGPTAAVGRDRARRVVGAAGTERRRARRAAPSEHEQARTSGHGAPGHPQIVASPRPVDGGTAGRDRPGIGGRRTRSAGAWSAWREPGPRREAAAAHERRHAQPARSAERDVDRAGHRARRRAASRSPTTTTPTSWCSPAPGAAFCSGLDLKDYGDHPEHRRAARRPHRAAVDAVLLAADPHAAPHAPAGARRDQRRRVRRRHVPLARGRAAHRGGVGRVQRDRHRQRAHEHRARRELAAAAARRRRALQRHAADRAARSTPTEALRMGLVSRVLPDDELLPDGARARRPDVRVQPLRARR